MRSRGGAAESACLASLSNNHVGAHAGSFPSLADCVHLLHEEASRVVGPLNEIARTAQCEGYDGGTRIEDGLEDIFDERFHSVIDGEGAVGLVTQCRHVFSDLRGRAQGCGKAAEAPGVGQRCCQAHRR